MTPARYGSRVLLISCLSFLALTGIGAPSALAEGFGIVPEGFTAGFSTLQAGGHPDLTTKIEFTKNTAGEAAASPRDIDVTLPPGLAGNPNAVPLCDMRRVENNTCPEASAIGVARTEVNPVSSIDVSLTSLIYNLAPYASEPAAFGFIVEGLPVRLDTSVRVDGATPGRYAIDVSAEQLSEAALVQGTAITFWGVPADHNGSGIEGEPGVEHYSNGTEGGEGTYGVRGSDTPTPFLTNPSTCGAGPLSFGLQTDSWVDPGVLEQANALSSASTGGEPSPITNCEALAFNPSLSVHPESAVSGQPTAYHIGLVVPQNENPEALATPDLKDVSVTLPQGTVLSPSLATGLRACPASGGEGINLEEEAPGHCPAASTLGTAEVVSPDVANPLSGHLYVREPRCGGAGQPGCTEASATNGELYGLYLEVAEAGVVVKLEGNVSVNPSTGQITSTFDNNPQFPVSSIEVDLNGGSRAPLANPTSCGEAMSTSQLTPWSSSSAAEPSSAFEVNGCAPQGFTPGFVAGTTNSQAGAYTPFSLSLTRSDGEQDLKSLQMTLPPGVSAKLAGIPQCSATDAAAGTCPEASRIGAVTVAAGPGSTPFYVSGRVFLTGPYNGGPFGEVVEVPAIAGPFNLGTVIVRGSIRINPTTAQATVVSDAFPSMLDGIPLQVKSVNVSLDRPSFTFNPTSCAPMSVAATISSTAGANAAVSSPFQAANCASLPFRPGFSASTRGQTSKANGASLTVRVAPGPGQANIAKVSLQLPKQFPSRLTTLQKACTEAQFNVNPAGCPEGSNIGTAKATTPILNTPLVGPAYLVSRGGAAFPDVEFILQGEGVTIELDGKTQIKNGITYSHFETVPDAPISSFETTLPEGPHSVLATNLPASANRSLCGIALNMPTTITGQNGAVLEQTTKIAVQGCAKAAALTRSQKLTKALKGCRADHKHSKKNRASCEQTARRRYAPPAKKTTGTNRKA